MAGRPRKTKAELERDGDKRKLGAHRFRELVDSKVDAKRGMPDMPFSLFERELSRDASDEDVAAEVRREAARAHFQRICRDLQAEGLLCRCDGEVIAMMAWNAASQDEAWASGARMEAMKLQGEFRACAALFGLCGDVSRTKLSKPEKPALSVEEAALADGLPPDVQHVQ